MVRLKQRMGIRDYVEDAPAFDDREGFEDGIGLAHDGRDLYLETETDEGETVVSILDPREVLAIYKYAEEHLRSYMR